MGDRLPRDAVCVDGLTVRCPWCRQDAGRATVTLEALSDSHRDQALAYPTRGAGETPDEGMLTADCPECGKPFMIALQGRGVVRLLAVRTDADAALLWGTPGRVERVKALFAAAHGDQLEGAA